MSRVRSHREHLQLTLPRQDRLNGAMIAKATDSRFTAVTCRPCRLGGVAKSPEYALAVDMGDW